MPCGYGCASIMAFPAPGVSQREIAPSSHRVWLNEQPTESLSLEQKFLQWTAAIEFDEALFQRHVYGNDEPTELDFRQHRACLCQAIATGETLAIEFLANNPNGDGAEYVGRIDEKLASLRAV